MYIDVNICSAYYVHKPVYAVYWPSDVKTNFVPLNILNETHSFILYHVNTIYLML